jgi:hypothetical protein
MLRFPLDGLFDEQACYEFLSAARSHWSYPPLNQHEPLLLLSEALL